MKKYLAIVLVSILLSSCKKENVERFDWRMNDLNGNNIGTIQNKTEQELLDCTSCGPFNGYDGRLGNIPNFNCMYNKVGEPEFCYKNSDGSNQIKCTEKFANCFKPTFTRFDCTNFNCGKWLVRYKITYCPSNSIIYSNIYTKYYCGDTATLFNSTTIINATNNHPPFSQTNGTSNICNVVMQRTNDLNGINFY